MTNIPAKQAEFFFRARPGRLPEEFVSSHRAIRLADRAAGRGDPSEQLPGSHGAVYGSWMQQADMTPAGVFASVFLARLPPTQVAQILNGLHEINRVEGQEWAGLMAKTIEDTAVLWKASSRSANPSERNRAFSASAEMVLSNLLEDLAAIPERELKQIAGSLQEDVAARSLEYGAPEYLVLLSDLADREVDRRGGAA